MRNLEKTQKVTVNIPQNILKMAQEATHKNITDTIKYALQEIAIRNAYDGLRNSRGKVKFSININKLREEK